MKKRVGKILLWVGIGFVFFILVIKICDQSTTIKQQRATIERLKTTNMSSEGSIDSEQVDSSSADREQELEEARIRISELEQQISGGVTDNAYLSLKFPTDGYYYKNRNDEIKFYSDPTCTMEITSEIKFMSQSIDSEEADNGLYIYCLRMDNGEICYCSQNKGCPDLVTEQAYNEEKEAEAANQ